ncbi:hypothetical protein JW887_00505 [Candidatus Dojkabacteria bacterium]|nr:hypothetical protein [Candidatus Dojkabacteria bacterium]
MKMGGSPDSFTNSITYLDITRTGAEVTTSSDGPCCHISLKVEDSDAREIIVGGIHVKNLSEDPEDPRYELAKTAPSFIPGFNVELFECWLLQPWILCNGTLAKRPDSILKLMHIAEKHVLDLGRSCSPVFCFIGEEISLLQEYFEENGISFYIADLENSEAITYADPHTQEIKTVPALQIQCIFYQLE